MQEADQANATFPERIYELAREHQMGVPLKAYRRSAFWWLLLSMIPWIIFLLADIDGYTIQAANSQKTVQYLKHCQACAQTDKNALSQFSASLLSQTETKIIFDIIIIVIMLLIISALLFYFWRRSPLYRCDRGLLLVSTKKHVVALHWDEIAEVYWSGARIWSLHDGDNKRGLDLTDFRNSWEIDTFIEHEVTPRLFTQALEQYKQAGSTQFGYLSIQHEGLVMNRPAASWKSGEVISWEELEDIRFADDSVSIKRHGVWQLWAGSSRRQKHLSRIIPNPTVYVALAKYLLENARIEEKRVSK